MIRVLLVDGEADVRCGLRMLLAVQPDMAVAGEASNVHDAIALAETLRPDVIVADIGMEAADGVDLVASLNAAAPGAVLIILTLHGDQNARARAQRAGARAFLEKYEGAADLLETLRRIAPDSPGSGNYSLADS